MPFTAVIAARIVHRAPVPFKEISSEGGGGGQTQTFFIKTGKILDVKVC